MTKEQAKAIRAEYSKCWHEPFWTHLARLRLRLAMVQGWSTPEGDDLIYREAVRLTAYLKVESNGSEAHRLQHATPNQLRVYWIERKLLAP